MQLITHQAINTLRRNARSVVRELGLLKDAYFDIGVTLAERHLLIELSESASPTMKEIAEKLLIDKSSASRLIARAEKKGYLKATIGENDRRERRLELTKKGKETLKSFEAIAFQQTEQALTTLQSDEVEKLYQGVSLYAKALQNSRLKDKSTPDLNIEPFEELETALNLIPFSLKYEVALYEIFRDEVESYGQLPYQDSSFEIFRTEFCQKQLYISRNEKDKVTGAFFIKANSKGRGDHIANAVYLVAKAHRGQGIGTKLVKASLHLAKKAGFKAIQYNMVLSENHGAVRLYKRLGFQIIGTIADAAQNQDETTQDAHIMYRNLGDL